MGITSKYDGAPTIGFDDLSHIKDLKFNDAEFLSYAPLNPFKIHLYHPVMSHKIYRLGAESEKPFVLTLGPSTIEKDDIIFKSIPKQLLHPLKVPSHKPLLPPDNIQKLTSLSPITETDPEFLLRWEKIDFLNALRPKEGDNIEELLQEFMSTCVGYDCLRLIRSWKIETGHYYSKRVNLPKGM